MFVTVLQYTDLLFLGLITKILHFQPLLSSIMKNSVTYTEMIESTTQKTTVTLSGSTLHYINTLAREYVVIMLGNVFKVLVSFVK